MGRAGTKYLEIVEFWKHVSQESVHEDVVEHGRKGDVPVAEEIVAIGV